ncbi:hypothetical protein [Streptacidiphilus sp. PAMC 29251]
MAVRSGWFGAVVAAAGAAAMVLVGAGTAAVADAQPAAGADAVAAQDACGAYSSELVAAAAPVEPGPAAEQLRAVGAVAQPLSYRQADQLPIGLWSAASVTLRVPAGRGTVRLALTSKGFSTDSMEVQRWVPTAHRWVDLTSSVSDAAFPTRATFSFTLTTSADATASGATAAAAHPETVALRLQDLDRPGSLSVAASYTDSHGHTSRAPALRSPVTRPESRFTGWPAHASLTRGGPAHTFTLTVRNTTDRVYPDVTALFYAYGMGGGQTLTPRDLVLQQYRAGRGWTALPLVASGCDPGMSAVPRPAAGVRLAPGATETVRLRLAVARTAPRGDQRGGRALGAERGGLAGVQEPALRSTGIAGRVTLPR